MTLRSSFLSSLWMRLPTTTTTLLPPGGACWILVFGPALAYFLSTRLSAGYFFWSEVGDFVTDQVQVLPGVFRACDALAHVFDAAHPQQPCVVTPSSSSSDVTLLRLKFPLQLVLSSSSLGAGGAGGGALNGVVDAIWRHDPDLGRGYLLLSESVGRGRLWRWEVGGGPIAIGKTLHLPDAGCRSRTCTNRRLSLDDDDDDPGNQPSMSTTGPSPPLYYWGSGALAIDFYQHGAATSPAEGRTHLTGALTVAEWGEGRIVRLEENGARTPLLMHVPCPISCSSPTEDDDATILRRDSEACSLPRILFLQKMAFSARGDLIVAVNYHFDNGKGNAAAPLQCDLRSSMSDPPIFDTMAPHRVRTAALVRLEHAVHVPPLASLRESRLAHEWTAVHHNHSVSILYTSPELVELGGMAIESAQTLFVSAILHNDDGTNRVVLLEVPVGIDNDDDDDDDEDLLLKKDNEEKLKAKLKPEPTVVLDLSAYTQRAGAVAVSQGGTFFVAAEQFVLIATRREGVVGRLHLGDDDETTPTAVVVGGDGYLYIATDKKLFRIRTREKPVQIPTNEVAHPTS